MSYQPVPALGKDRLTPSFVRRHIESCVTMYNEKGLNPVQTLLPDFSAMCYYTKFGMASSGLSAGRRHLQRFLKLVCEDKVAEVVITYEDRLTRFGQEFLETLFACFDVTLTVLEPGEEKTPEQELTDDLLTLIASFSGRLYGMRSHKQKELLQCAQAVLTSP